ncbi:MAG: hypothetical protein ACU0C9_10780 [Paracoccaceae bacterium]
MKYIIASNTTRVLKFFVILIVAFLALLILSAREAVAAGNTSFGETFVPTIWVDPDGCDHWIIDDGVEGYLSQRLDRSGKPVCSGRALANTAIGDFKNGSSFFDPI